MKDLQAFFKNLDYSKGNKKTSEECRTFKTSYERIEKELRKLEKYMLNEKEVREHLYGRPYKTKA
ncbi:hypothetical protein OTK01_000360 [Caldicellulosiruptor acetigenus]|uniref:hypothetical protein n=1 Tax=Caldicellulosiruptor acetigenus TaxID=301953 RepID=UPI0022A91D48|nr:hypothetical protein [Caldicellulosiruptor acetigenus]WAM36586.1 hypothetical protein OTK01_000360 [Caldicellulosiruptor acetigenus]